MKPKPIVKTKRKIPMVTRGWTTLQKIQGYYKYGGEMIKLNESENKIRKRYMTIFSMSQKWYTISEIAKKISSIYDIDITMAYRDIKAAQQVFVDYLAGEENYVKGLLLEIYREGIRKNKETGDWDMVEKFGNRIEKLMGFDKDKTPLPFDPSELGTKKIILTIDPKVVENEISRLEKLTKEFDAEFAEYEELSS